MLEWVKVGVVDDFPEGKGRSVRVADRRVAVFKVEDRLHAIQDACPHMGAWLCDGKVDGGAVICHWHGWRFDFLTGEGDHGKRAGLRARVYEVKVEGADVFLRAPEDPPPPDEEEWVRWDPKFLK